jgi:hypothetical protein
MSKFYAKTLVAREGAPMGNKNAAGPHRITAVRTYFNKGTKNPEGHINFVDIKHEGRALERGYYKPTRSSQARLSRVLAKGVSTGKIKKGERTNLPSAFKHAYIKYSVG